MSSNKRQSMSFGLAAVKLKLQTQIAGLERRKKRRQEQFGIDYIKLVLSEAKKSEIKECLQRAVKEMDEVNRDIESCYDEIETRTAVEFEKQNEPAASSTQENPRGHRKSHTNTTGEDQEDQNSSRELHVRPPKGGKRDSQGGRGGAAPKRRSSTEPAGRGRGEPGRGRGQPARGRGGPSRGQASGRGRGRGPPPGRGRSGPPAGRSGRGRSGPPAGRSGRGRGGPPAGRSGRGRGGPPAGRSGRGRGRGPQVPMSPGAGPHNVENRLPKRVADRDIFQPRHSPEGKRSRLSAVNLALAPEEFKPGSDIQKWTHHEWKFREYKTNGGWSKTTEGLVEKCAKPIKRGIQKFKAHPELFIAFMYPTEMVTWPEDEQEYTLIYRAGTTGLQPKGVSPKGQVTFLMHEYQPLPSLPNDELPKKFRDEYTDTMTYRGKKLVTKSLPAYLPGRGTGLLDDPRLKVIGDIDPSDIAQGQVGDCWLLSGIASLAEFDGAIERLFRKTKDLHQMPFADGRPNTYTITLWDLPTWTEVDIVVDERLCAREDIKGALFGAKASEDGELWVCYLEKAIAAHCGGYDKIDGGQCTHAWSLLTGCKEQYIIQRIPDDPEEGPFGIWAKYDTEADRWADHANSPSDGQQGVWRVPWPDVGGGGEEDADEEGLFLRMCTWSHENFLIGASSKGDSDRNLTNGVVDNHAYSVIDCRSNVAGTGIGMIQVRNPWGYGTIENGMFTRGGKGWKEYPEIEQALEYEELEEDDGVFWVTTKEFFDHYRAIYLGAVDMKKFLGVTDTMNNFNPYAANKVNPAIGMLSTPDLGSDEDESGDDESDDGESGDDESEEDIEDAEAKGNAQQPVVVGDAEEENSGHHDEDENEESENDDNDDEVADEESEGEDDEEEGKNEESQGEDDDEKDGGNEESEDDDESDSKEATDVKKPVVVENVGESPRDNGEEESDGPDDEDGGDDDDDDEGESDDNKESSYEEYLAGLDSR